MKSKESYSSTSPRGLMARLDKVGDAGGLDAIYDKVAKIDR